MDDLGFDMLAASLRADASDLDTFLDVLADKLQRALPGRVAVDRSGGGFFSREKKVRRVEVSLDKNRYELIAAGGGRVQPRRATAVRGIVLKTEEIPLDEWIDALSHDLATEAERSESARTALQKLLGV